jgi:hypothetical protein
LSAREIERKIAHSLQCDEDSFTFFKSHIANYVLTAHDRTLYNKFHPPPFLNFEKLSASFSYALLYFLKTQKYVFVFKKDSTHGAVEKGMAQFFPPYRMQICGFFFWL